MTRNKPPPSRAAPGTSWCNVRDESIPLSVPAVSVRTRDGFRVVRTEWFVDVPSERAAQAVVMPELPKQPALRPPRVSKAPGVKVWVVPSGSGFRVVPANAARPTGARLMRLVAEEQDQEALAMLDALASR
ncbi:MAG: hypothetical protein JW940_19890 [Polyangiaceae bacterium]|nr:hypothetical protein [Polyangiaceae bacterium]